MPNLILTFSVIIAAFVGGYLTGKLFGRGRIRLIDNIGRKFGAEPFYHHIEAYDKPSGNIDLLFTHQELNRAINRAEQNKEDF